MDPVGLGRSEYLAFCDLLGIEPTAETPLERQRQLPPWICSDLILRPVSRERLRRWAQAGMPEADPAHVRYVGCPDVLRQVVDVLRAVPAPVRHHVVTSVLVIGIGQHAAGWWGAIPALPSSEHEPTSMIGLTHGGDDAELRALIAHEVGHAWSLATPAPYTAQQAKEGRAHRARHLTLAAQWGMLDEVSREPLRDEQLAARLAARWGFAGVASDPAMAAEHTRARLRREVDQ